MTAPRRIIDEPSVSGEVRDAVRKLRADRPHFDVALAVTRFEATIGAAPAVEATTHARWALATKLLVVVSLVGVGLTATYALVAPNNTTPSAAGPPAPAAVAPSPAAELRPHAEEVPSVSVESLPSAPPTSTIVRRPPELDLADEREREVHHLVDLQRIAASDPMRAITLAKAGHGEFRHGVLFQEREVILVDALAQVGQAHEASERAQAFVKAYPRSPAAPRMRAIAEGAAP